MTDLATVHAEGRLIRRRWSAVDEEGRQLLCLYTALAGDPAARPDGCPASLAPKWIAYLLPWLDDAPSKAAWPGIVERVVAIAPRLAEVPPECEWQVRALCVREMTMRYADDDAVVLAICERVASLCERRGRGEVVDESEMVAAYLEAGVAGAAWVAWAAAGASWAAWAAAGAAEGASDRLADAILTTIEHALESP